MDAQEHESAPLPDQFLATALELLRGSGQAHLIPIQGESMLPLIQDGDQLLIAPGTAGIGRGDVILFLQGSQLFAHRVLATKETSAGTTLLTKGDNVLLPDPPVPLQKVIGRVTMIQRGQRKISLDTAAWQHLGDFLAVLMLLWSWSFQQARRLKRRLGIGPGSRLTQPMTRLARRWLQLLLRTLQRLFTGYHA